MEKFYTITQKSLDDEGVENLSSLWTKAKEKGFTALSYEVPTQFKSVDKEENLFDVIFSSAKEDRHGDIVMQDFELKNFKKNPAFIDSHNYGSIEHIIGKVTKIDVVKGKLQGQIKYALMNPKGALAYEMTKAGFINATSIGFIPLEFDKDFKILRSELLEISAVAVPSQAESLFKQIVEEEITIEKETAEEESTEEGKIETPAIVNKKMVTILSIAKAINSMEAKNQDQKRRDIYKAIRSL